MNKVIFELKNGTKKEFDGEKFTDEHIKIFNGGSCTGITCKSCPCRLTTCQLAGGILYDHPRVYRVTEESKPVQILKRLLEGGSVWVDGVERNISDLSIGDNTSWYSLNHEHITLEKPKKKVKVDLWLNVYHSGNISPHRTKESADICASTNRIACEHFVREYEV